MARTLGDAFVTVRPDTSGFPRELERDLRAIFSRATGRGFSDVEIGADTSRLPRQLQADVRSITQRVSRGGGADVEVGADTSRLPRVLQGRVLEASRRVSRSGAGDVEVGVDGARLPRELQTRVEDATRRVERSGASEVEVRPDTARFDREVPDRIGRTMRRAAGVAAAAFGALQVGSFFKDTVEQASDLTESVNVVGLTFKEAAPELDDFFRTSAQSIGLTTSAAQQAASNIGGLLNNMGYTRSESAQTSKSVLTLGADLGSAFNKDPAQAVEAIGAALRGETEPIRAFNVTIDDARVKAKALEMGLYSGKGAIDANAKAQATLALITQQTADVQGDFANTSTGLANAQRVAAAGYGNLQAVIGQALLPAQTTLVNQLNSAVLPALTTLAAEKAPAVGAALGAASEKVGAFIAGLDRRGPIDGFTGRANTAGLGVRALFDAMRDGDVTSDGFVGDMERAGVKIGEIIEVVKGAGDQVQRAAGVARAAFAGEDVTTVGWLGRVGDVAYAARDGVDAIAAFDWASLGAAVKSAAGDGDQLGPALSSIATSASELLPFVVELVRSVPSLSDVLSVAAPIFAFLADHVDTLIELMPLLVSAFVAYKVAQAAANVAATAGVALRIAEIASRKQHAAALRANTAALGGETVAKSRGTVATIAHTVAERAMTIAKRTGAAATALATGAFKGLTAAMRANPIGAIVTAITLLVGGLVWFFTQTEAGQKIVQVAWAGIQAAVAVVVDWFRDSVLPTVQKVWAGISQGAGAVLDWLRQNWPLLLGILGGPIGAIVAFVVTHWSEISQATSEMVGKVLDFFTGLRDGARDRVTRMRDWVVDVATRLLEAYVAFGMNIRDRVLGFFTGLRDGARDRVTRMRDWVVDVANRLLEAYVLFGLNIRDRVLGFFTGLRDGARDRVQLMKDWVVDVANRLLVAYVLFGLSMRDRVLGFFADLRDGARARVATMRDWVVDLATRLRDAVTGRVRGLRDDALGAFNALRDRGRDAMWTLRDGIRNAFNAIRTVAAKPVNFLINTVYMGGIKKLADKVSEKLGLGITLPTIEAIPERRRGGWTPKGTVLVGEEGPELVNFARPGMVYTAAQTKRLLADRPMDAAGDPWANKNGGVTSGPDLLVTRYQQRVQASRRMHMYDNAPLFDMGGAIRSWLANGLDVDFYHGRPPAGRTMSVGSWAEQVRSLSHAAHGRGITTLGEAEYGTGRIRLATDPDRTAAERRKTAIHEVGHILGLAHPSSGRSVMRAMDGDAADAPTSADMARLAALYPRRATDHDEDVPGGLSGALKAVAAVVTAPLRALVTAGVGGLLQGMPGSGLVTDIARGLGQKAIDGLVAWATRREQEQPGSPDGPLPPVVGGWMRPGGGGVITSEFGMRRHPLTGRTKLHNGIDVSGLQGLRVLAAQAGRVIQAGRVGSYGNFVQLQHSNGYKTGYAHLARILVSVGQAVTRGQQVGVEGATGGVTGRHLHFNVNNGGWINPRRLGVFDDGGVATGRGLLPKLTPRPERVLSPRQTASFDRLVELLERDGLAATTTPAPAADQQIGGFYVSGDVVIRSDEDLRELQRSQRDALAAAGLLS